MAKTPQLHCGNIGSIPIGVNINIFNINIFNISNDNRQYNFFDNTLSIGGARFARPLLKNLKTNNKFECRLVISQWVKPIFFKMFYLN